MALRTQIRRDGENLPLPHGWGGWHLAVLADVIRRECDLPAQTPMLTAFTRSPHVVESPVSYRDPEDGEVLTLLPGDVLDTWED